MFLFRSPIVSPRLAALLLATGLAATSAAQAQSWQRVDAVQQHIGDASVQTDGLDIELPLVAEDGSSVPLTVTFGGTLSPTAHVAELHIFAPRNPTPEVASFAFGPEATPLALETRVRLSESQAVIVVARTSEGAVHVAERDVRVTTSGCVAPAGGAEVAQEMQARVRIPDSLPAGGTGEILTRILHPMHTGLADAPDGQTPPQRIIESFDATLDGRRLVHATYYRSLAANPYLRFQFTPTSGGEVVLTWTEDTGRSTEEEARITVG